MLFLIAIGIFLVIVGSTWWAGLWSNLLTLINLLIAGLVASSFYQNVAMEINELAPSYGLLVDFISVWALFIITFVLLRTATDMLSSMRLKFDQVTEMIGRSILSIWIALVFICFTFFTLHMAPLKPDFYGRVEQKMLGVGPDHFWLAFIQSRSRGALSESQDSTLWPEYWTGREHPDDAELNARVFDPFADFASDHWMRRRDLSRRPTLRVPTE